MAFEARLDLCLAVERRLESLVVQIGPAGLAAQWVPVAETVPGRLEVVAALGGIAVQAEPAVPLTFDQTAARRARPCPEDQFAAAVVAAGTLQEVAICAAVH